MSVDRFRYEVEHPEIMENCVIIEIDNTEEAMEKVREMVNFWSGSSKVETDEEYRERFVRLTATTLFNEFAPQGATPSMIESFKKDPVAMNVEGFYPLDGRHGVEVVKAEIFSQYVDTGGVYVTSMGMEEGEHYEA